MSGKLTAKQEKFVQGLVEGKSQRQAYIDAGYKTDNASNKTIDEAASRLFKNSKVSARYSELMSKHEEKALWTREMAVESLMWLKGEAIKDIEVNGVRQANSGALTNAIKELNSMEGMYHSDRIAREKLKLEKEKMTSDNNAEDKISQFMDTLKEALTDE